MIPLHDTGKIIMKFAIKLAFIGWVGLIGFAAQPASAVNYILEELVNGLDMPWGIAFLPDGDMLVTELSGQLRLIREGELQAQPVAGVPEIYYAGQGGLMDILLHPDFPTNNIVYLSLAVGDRDANTLRVIRGRFEGTVLELSLIHI